MHADPLFYYSKEYNLRDFVLMNCTGSNSPDGGKFSGASTTITMLSTLCRAETGKLLPAGPGNTTVGAGDMLPLEQCSTFRAKYTTDGSEPTNSSTTKIYSGPFSIDKTTVVRALISGIHNGEDRPIVHTMTYTKEEADGEGRHSTLVSEVV